MLEMILVDWTRMGKGFCLAGQVVQQNQPRIVRPLLAKNRGTGERKLGWPAYALARHSRWEIFELVGHLPAESQPPHLEDLWVHGMRSRGRLAEPEQRRAILESTLAKPGEPLFGANLLATHAAGYLQPETGQRSLVTIKVASAKITFAGSRRGGATEPDFRVELPIPELGPRRLPVKDHHLLLQAAAAGQDLDRQITALNETVRAMGETVAVRLGLSRAFQQEGSQTPAVCWLMADGFFSWSEPQP